VGPADNIGSGGDFLWSAQAFRLPDNVIVVQGGRPTISSPSATPNLVDPTVRLCGPGEGVDIGFDLDLEAAVTLSVFNMETQALLRVIPVGTLLPGIHTAHWDGKTVTGEWAREGPYRIDMTATTPAGNRSHLRRVLVYVDY
jgi:hypothetical protein